MDIFCINLYGRFQGPIRIDLGQSLEQNFLAFFKMRASLMQNQTDVQMNHLHKSQILN